MRAFAERVYGIPPEQVIGSVADLKFEIRDGKPVLIRQAAPSFLDDNVFKPVAIQRHIGRRPIAAARNVGVQSSWENAHPPAVGRVDPVPNPVPNSGV